MAKKKNKQAKKSSYAGGVAGIAPMFSPSSGKSSPGHQSPAKARRTFTNTLKKSTRY